MQEPPRPARAVSPVIGIILVVAITVMLAAVVGVFATDIGGDTSKAAQAGASVEFMPDNDGDGEVRITYIARGNSERIEVQYSVDPAGNTVSAPDGTVVEAPGNTVTLTEDGGNSDQDITVSVTVIAVESTGESSVVLEKEGEI